MPRYTFRKETVIPAHPDKVWAVFTDFDSYPDWATYMSFPGAHKPKQVGQTFNLKLTNKDGSNLWFTPKVTVLSPQKELRWTGKLWGSDWVFVGDHFFNFEASEDQKSTKFIHGENSTGLVVPFLLCTGTMTKIQAEFADFNEQLKARVMSTMTPKQ
eukprot:jgi/Chrzof1/2423/Cz11g15020.t1